MVSSLEVEIAELCCSCRPIFNHSPCVGISHSENIVDIRNDTEPSVAGPSSTRSRPFRAFGYRNRLPAVARRKTTRRAARRWAASPRDWPSSAPSAASTRRSSLSEIARSARIPAATARRCLLTLEELGYVTRSGRDFLLRPKVLELGAAYLESMNIEQVTRNHLEELARSTADSAALCVLDGVEIVYVARASVRTLLRLEAHVGSRFPGARDLHRPRAARRA